MCRWNLLFFERKVSRRRKKEKSDPLLQNHLLFFSCCFGEMHRLLRHTNFNSSHEFQRRHICAFGFHTHRGNNDQRRKAFKRWKKMKAKNRLLINETHKVSTHRLFSLEFFKLNSLSINIVRLLPRS